MPQVLAVASCILAVLYAVSGGFLAVAAAVAGAVLFFFVQREMRKIALGFVYDERGERQKVEIRDGDNFIFTPTSHHQRTIEEAVEKKTRRRDLIGYGIFGWGSAYITVLASTSNSPMKFVFICIPGLLAATLLAIWLRSFFLEIAYQLGYQGMKGAKVLDPAPIRPGLREVAQEKAHADGRVATEDEAEALLMTKKKY